MRGIHTILTIAVACAFATTALAQLSAPLDICASRPIFDPQGGNPLPGSNPSGGQFGFTPQPGALIHIIDAGADGQAGLPDALGQPSGDDSLFATSAIGTGIVPGLEDSGLFAQSFSPAPLNGTVLYARVFNGTALENSTHWGQTGTFTVNAPSVMDLSSIGLTATMQPIGVDAALTDSDGDGRSNLEELWANTNATDPLDFFRIRIRSLALGSETIARVVLDGQPGRNYCLERCIDLTAVEPAWEHQGESGVLASLQSGLEMDDQPPAAAAYRVRIEFP